MAQDILCLADTGYLGIKNFHAISQINGKNIEVTLSELLAGPKFGYLGGFLTPGYSFHRAVPKTEYTSSINSTHQVETHSRDWYYVRVRQHNGQWAMGLEQPYLDRRQLNDINR